MNEGGDLTSASRATGASDISDLTPDLRATRASDISVSDLTSDLRATRASDVSIDFTSREISAARVAFANRDRTSIASASSNHLPSSVKAPTAKASARRSSTGGPNDFKLFPALTRRFVEQDSIGSDAVSPSVCRGRGVSAMPTRRRDNSFLRAYYHDRDEAEITALIAGQLRSNFLFISLDDAAIVEMAGKFQRREYEPGEVLVEQGSLGDDIDGGGVNLYYYILVDGECEVWKDGKRIHGKYGVIERGADFGEIAMLFDNIPRSATVVATKASSATRNVVAYRLKDTVFREMLGDAAMRGLRGRYRKIQAVTDIMSGVETKFGKGTIIRPYVPSRLWLSSQWSGTVLQYVWMHVLGMMALTTLFGVAVCAITGKWSQDAEHAFTDQLDLIGGWWSSLTPLTTFVSAFFLVEAYKFWKRFYWTTRGIQGACNDVSLILASIATRDKGDTGGMDQGAAEALDDIARIFRHMHIFYWCLVVKRFQCLVTPEGFSYLRSKKLLTHDEFLSLMEVGENSLGAHHASITWLTSRISLALKRGEIEDNTAALVTVYNDIQKLRGLMARIPDMYDGRMPLAYIHFVHMLIELLILVSPVALFPRYWFWSVLAVGILTLFYLGLFKLSMMFLDPVDNDKKHQTSSDQTVAFDVGVLIRESHTGSLRFKGCAAALPKY